LNIYPIEKLTIDDTGCVGSIRGKAQVKSNVGARIEDEGGEAHTMTMHFQLCEQNLNRFEYVRITSKRAQKWSTNL